MRNVSDKSLGSYLFGTLSKLVIVSTLVGVIALVVVSVQIYLRERTFIVENVATFVDELFESITRKAELTLLNYFDDFKSTLDKLESIYQTRPEELESTLAEEYELLYSQDFLEIRYSIMNSNGLVYMTNYEKDRGRDLSKLYYLWEIMNLELKKSRYFLRPLAAEYETGRLRTFVYKKAENGDIIQLVLTAKPHFLGEEFGSLKKISPFIEQVSILHRSEPISPIFERPRRISSPLSPENLYKHELYVWHQVELAKLPVSFYVYIKLNFWMLFLVVLITLAVSVVIVGSYFFAVGWVSNRVASEMKKIESAIHEYGEKGTFEVRNWSFIREVNDVLEVFSSQAEIISLEMEEIKNLNEELEASYRNVEKLSQEIRDAFYDFATRLVYLVEGLEEETGKHLQRVRLIVEKIAGKLIDDEKLREEIVYFSPLHDIGKVFIPPEILNKPGRLTEEEWNEVKKHTVYAERLLSHPRFKVALNIAKYHHENYDGTGYMEGLKGEEIPLEARIVKIADVYDALVTERPYKRAFSKEEALKIIFEGDGRVRPEHFDPKVLEAFREIVDLL